MRHIVLVCLFLNFLTAAQAATENVFLNLPQLKCRPETMKIAPRGNTQENIPELPQFTVLRLKTFEGIFDLPNAQDTKTTQQIIQLGKKRIPQVLAVLRREGLLKEISKVAKLYNVDALQILAPIVAEKVLNGFLDAALQDSMASFFTEDLLRIDQTLQSTLNHPETKQCMNAEISNYWKWTCISHFSEQTHGNLLAAKVKKAGTCGIAQFNPILLWSLNDTVVRISGLEPVRFGDVKSSLKIVLTPKKIIHYLGAYAKTISEIYKNVACVDISKNAGLVTSLYSLGNEYRRAYYAKENPQGPTENFLGWFINYFEAPIRLELQNQ